MNIHRINLQGDANDGDSNNLADRLLDVAAILSALHGQMGNDETIDASLANSLQRVCETCQREVYAVAKTLMDLSAPASK